MTQTSKIVLLILALVFSVSAQVDYIYEDKIEDKETTPIAIKASDPNIKKVRIIFETSGSSVVKDLSETRVAFVDVDLKNGKNKFNILAYDADDNIIPINSKVILIEKKSKEPKVAEVQPDKPVKPKPEGTSGTNQSEEKDKWTPGDQHKLITRAIVGLEQVGASSANSNQNPFFEFFFSSPLRLKSRPFGKDKRSIGTTLSVWGNMRFTTTPVQGIASLSNFTPINFATNFVQGDSLDKVNKLVHTFDFLIGAEQEIVPPSNVFDGIIPGAGRTSLSLIVAGGAVNPLSTDKTAVTYKIPRVNNNQDIDPLFLKIFPEAAGKTNVTFVSPERDRFFRQYYAGFRMKTFFNSKELRYTPAMLDIMFGQNEAITSKLQGVILRFDGSVPIAYKKADFLYLFGSTQMKLGKNVNRPIPPFFLETAQTDLTGEDTVIIPIDRSPFLQSNRDIFRIGVGVDLFKLFKGNDDEADNKNQKNKGNTGNKDNEDN